MKNLFTLLLLTISSISYSQAPGIIWNKTLGGSATDAILLEPYSSYPVEIIRTPDGLGFVVITSTSSRDGDVTGSHGRLDIWVIKMNFNGDTIWTKTLGGTQYDYSQKSFVHSDGSITIFGYSESVNGDVIGAHGNRDIWVVKLSSSGILLWQRPLGGSAEDGLRSVEVLPDNSYIIAGYTFSNNGDVSGNHGSADIWVVKLSSSGILQWQKCYGGSNEDRPRAVQSIPGNQYLVVGSTFSNNGDVSGNHGGSDAWIFKVDNAGTILTKKLYGGSFDEVAYKVVVADNGSYVIMGGTYSNNGDVSGFHGVEGVSGRDTWVFCIDPVSFALQWQKCIGGSLEELPSHMVKNTNGDVIIFSSTFSNDGDAITSRGYVDILCVSLNSSGVINWSKCVGGLSIDHPGVTYLSPIDNSMVFIGVTDSPDGDVQGYHGGGDAWVVKLNSSGNVVWQRPLGGSSVEHAFFIDAINDNEYLIACDTKSDDGDLHYNNRPGTLWILRMGPVNRIKGTEFADFNRNGIKDAEEPFSDWPVQAEKPGYTRITVPFNDSFLLEVDSGNINTKIVSQNLYYDITPLNHTTVFPGFGGLDSVTFVLTPRPGIRDLMVNLAALNCARPGRPLSYKLIYKNVGTDTVASGTVLFKRDSRLEYISSSPPNNSISGDTLKWNYTNLLPFDTALREITINFWVPSPPAVNINDTLSSIAIITPVSGDLTPADDTIVLKQIVVAAFDPNDKTENLGGKITLQQVSSGTYINYLVRFQNVGTDTAFNIIIRDTLSSKLDWNSFQTVAASHKYKLKVTDQNKIKWNFENIKLVDSTHNEPASHGYILFRIKSKTDLVLGDTIKNSASVYFDVNLPVKTNTQNTIVSNNVIPQPTISSFTPTSAGTGINVTITGTNFAGTTAVSFGGVAATSFIVNSSTTITAVVGTGASGNVSVTTAGGITTLSGFTFIAAPSITSFTPIAAASGSTVTITGTNFTGATAVTFGGTAASSFTVVNASTITAVVGSGASGNITITAPGGTASLSGFTFIAAPSITSFTPSSAASGTSVTITGTDFTGATAVTFGGTAASSFTVVNASTITAVVGSGASGNINVTTPGGSASRSGFIFIAAPTITSFTPNNGTSGATITITGTNFTGATAVSFGGIIAQSFAVNSATTITAVVANGATGSVSVMTPGGTATLAGFTFNAVTGIGGPGSINSADLTVNPNPARDFLIIKHPTSNKNAQLVFYDITGKKVKVVLPSRNTNRTDVIVNNLACGIYALKWTDGTRVLSRILVVIQ